jgi:hypothetical protein
MCEMAAELLRVGRSNMRQVQDYMKQGGAIGGRTTSRACLHLR